MRPHTLTGTHPVQRVVGWEHDHSPDPPQGLWQLPSPGGAGKVERQWLRSFLRVQKSPVRIPTLSLLKSQVRKVSRRDTESSSVFSKDSPRAVVTPYFFSLLPLLDPKTRVQSCPSFLPDPSSKVAPPQIRPMASTQDGDSV